MLGKLLHICLCGWVVSAGCLISALIEFSRQKGAFLRTLNANKAFSDWSLSEMQNWLVNNQLGYNYAIPRKIERPRANGMYVSITFTSGPVNVAALLRSVGKP